MIDTIPCAICGSATQPAGRKTGRQSGRVFELRRCLECGFAWVSNPLTDYASIYNEAYYEGRGADPLVDYAFEFEHPLRSIRQYEWKGIERAITHLRPNASRWLDYGSGNGGLVRFLRARGRDAVGFDTGAWAEKARQHGIPIVREEELDALAGSFDVITAIEVIEHIVDPLPALQRMRTLLKPGGLLFLTTGNADTAPPKIAEWPYVIPEIHVSFFTPRAMAMVLERAGFEPAFVGRVPGWSDIIRFKVLKNLRVRQTATWEQVLPWALLAPLADWKFRVSAHPVGVAK